MPEQFLIRTEGGPLPGVRVTDACWTWPLPDTLPATGGEYRKTSESDLPPMPEDQWSGPARLLRGASYRWEAGAKMLTVKCDCNYQFALQSVHDDPDDDLRGLVCPGCLKATHLDVIEVYYR